MSPTPSPFARTASTVGYVNRYGTLFDDEIVSGRGVPGRYLRWVWSRPGVVVVATNNNRVLLVPTYRYPVAEVTPEFPRGGAEVGESAGEAAVRELEEETGYTAHAASVIGQVYADTGLIETPVSVVQVQVALNGAGPARLEDMESVGVPAWYEATQVDEMIASGEVMCALTISSFSIWRMARSSATAI